MRTLFNATKPVLDRARRFIRTRSSVKGFSSNLGSRIVAVLFVVELLVTYHSVWMPWVRGFFAK